MSDLMVIEQEIRVSGVVHYLGQYADAQSAHVAYVAAKRAMHKGGTL